MSTTTTNQTIKVSDEQAKQHKLNQQIAAIKAIGLDSQAEKAAITAAYKSAGLTPPPAARFERFNFTVNNPKSKQNGQVIPLIAINPDKGQSKTITLWQARILADNFDEFILFYEGLKEELASGGYDLNKLMKSGDDKD